MLDKTLVIIAGIVIAVAWVIASSLPYVLDFLGEILIVCGGIAAVPATLWVAYKAMVAMGQARLSNREHDLHMQRLEIENHRLMLDTQLVAPVGNVLPVSRQLVVSGQVADKSFGLLEMNIDANRKFQDVPTTQTYAPHITYKNDVKGVEKKEQQVLAAPFDAPREFRKDMLSKTEILLGYTDEGPLYLEPHEVKSIVCGGKSGMGKSNTTRFLLAQYANLGWKIAIFDPHGDSKQGILPSLMPLKRSFYMEPAIEFDAGMEMLRCIMAEGLRRKEVKNSSPEDFQPILFVIDEVAEIAALSSDDEREYAEKNLPIILKSFRKYNIYGMFISQFWSQSDMGKMGFLLRRAAQSRILHQMAPDSAKVIEQYADHEEIDSLPKGTCIFNNSEIKRMKLVIPLCEPHHIKEIMGTSTSTSTSTSNPTSNPTSRHQITEVEIDTMEVVAEVLPVVDAEVVAEVVAEVTDEHLIYIGAASLLKLSQRMRVEDALGRGDSNGKIIAEVFDYPSKTSGRKGQQYSRMINGVRIELGMKLPSSPARKEK